MTSMPDPLTGPIPAEIPLPRAPLVRVLAQLRFAPIASILKADFIAPFQEAIRGEYGILETELAKSFEIGPAGVVTHPDTTNAWRFFDTTRKWRVTLAADFLSVETMAYESRADFLARLTRAIIALKQHVNPAVVTRLGVRYVDRVADATREDVVALVTSDALGILGTDIGQRAQFAVVDNLFDIEDGQRLRARWGMLPPRFTMDPVTIEPLDKPCWVLDLDASLEREQELDADALSAQSKLMSERVYRFFRWVVTDEFLRRFGGAV